VRNSQVLTAPSLYAAIVLEFSKMQAEEIAVVEPLSKMKTLKGTSVLSGFQWGQCFRGRAD